MARYRASSATYDPAQFITASALQRRCDQQSRVVLPPCFSASLRHCRPVCLCSQLCGAQTNRCLFTFRSGPPICRYTASYQSRIHTTAFGVACVQTWLMSPVCRPKIYVYFDIMIKPCSGMAAFLQSGLSQLSSNSARVGGLVFFVI